MVFCWLDQAITYYYRSVSPAIHDDDIAVDLAKLLTDWSAQLLSLIEFIMVGLAKPLHIIIDQSAIHHGIFVDLAKLLTDQLAQPLSHKMRFLFTSGIDQCFKSKH